MDASNDSDGEVEKIDDETGNFMASGSGSGCGTKILYGQWKETIGAVYDLSDDDFYEDQIFS